MRYKINIKFKDNTEVNTEVDGFATSDCVLKLYTHKPFPDLKIRIFPLLDIVEINVEGIIS